MKHAIPPSLEAVLLLAIRMDLPELEAKKLFYFYESKGWKVGKVTMVSLEGAMAGWKIRWQENQDHETKRNSPDRDEHTYAGLARRKAQGLL